MKIFSGHWFWLLPLLCAWLVRCGYFDSALNSPQPTSTSLSGRVVDSLSGEGLSGIRLTLSGLRDTVVMSGENGLFQFSKATTGNKHFSVEGGGYRVKSFDLDLTKEPNRLDTVRLVRANRPPRILKVAYPGPGLTNAPRNLRSILSIYDDDVDLPLSRESLTFHYYRGESPLSLPAVDSGTLRLLALPFDSSLAAPGKGRLAVLPSARKVPLLSPSARYYWRFVVTDLFGDSAVWGTDSFTTRAMFGSSDSCPPGMALVEVETTHICMDRFEASNNIRAIYDSVHFRLPDSLKPFSPSGTHPAIRIYKTWADTVCVRMGKRLCTISEWRAAFGGYERSTYPYGNVYDSSKCNTEMPSESLYVEQATTNPSGSDTGCVSGSGIYDLSGNVAEWVENNLANVDPLRYPYVYWGFEILPYHYFAGGNWDSKRNSTINSISKFLIENVSDTVLRIDVGFRCCKTP